MPGQLVVPKTRIGTETSNINSELSQKFRAPGFLRQLNIHSFMQRLMHTLIPCRDQDCEIELYYAENF
jgi:hypothetical protein